MRELTIWRGLDKANPIEAIILDHPTLSMRSLSTHITRGRQASLLLFEGTPGDLAALHERYIDKPPRGLEKATVVRELRRSLVLYEVEEWSASPTNIAQSIYAILGPETVARLRKSAEGVRYDLLSFRQEAIPQFLRELREQGRVLERTLTRPVATYELAKLTSGAPYDTAGEGELLSPREDKVARAAVRAGYYDLPKKCGVEEVARKLRMPKSTAQYNLQRAEGKVMRAWLSE